MQVGEGVKAFSQKCLTRARERTGSQNARGYEQVGKGAAGDFSWQGWRYFQKRSATHQSLFRTASLRMSDESNIVQIEHTRHRSIGGFAANLMAAMTAYSFLPKKPSLNIETIEKERRIA